MPQTTTNKLFTRLPYVTIVAPPYGMLYYLSPLKKLHLALLHFEC